MATGSWQHQKHFSSACSFARTWKRAVGKRTAHHNDTGQCVYPLTSSFIRHISVKMGMKLDDASLLLAALSGITDSDMERKVAEALDYQPLAIASAATYVKQLRQRKPVSHFGWNDYLDKVGKGHRLTTEAILADANPSYPKSMTKTTELAVDEIVKSEKIINHTFSFLSMCAPEPLGQDIVIIVIVSITLKGIFFCRDQKHGT